MPKKIDAAVNARALRMFAEHRQDCPSDTALAEAVAKKVGIGRETARRWLVQADVDAGARPGAPLMRTKNCSTRLRPSWHNPLL